jgi:hypothetical protein
MRVCVVLLRQKLCRVAKGASAPIARRKTCVTRFRPALRNASDADRSNWREVIAALGGVAAVKKEEVTCFVKWH